MAPSAERRGEQHDESVVDLSSARALPHRSPLSETEKIQKEPEGKEKSDDRAIRASLPLPVRRESVQDKKNYEQVRSWLRENRELGVAEVRAIHDLATERLGVPKASLAENGSVVLIPTSLSQTAEGERLKAMLSPESGYRWGSAIDHVSLSKLGGDNSLSGISGALRSLGFNVVGVALPSSSSLHSVAWKLLVHKDT